MANERFTNPPVVEICIAVNFQPLDDNLWMKRSSELCKSLEERYPKQETVIQDEIQIIKRTTEGFPKEAKGRSFLTQFQLWSEDKFKMLWIGRDSFGFRKTRNQKSFPGFKDVHSEFSESAQLFLELLQPEKITNVAVTYIDDFVIPVKRGHTLDLNDYIKLNVFVPDFKNTGAISAFDCSIQLNVDTKTGEKGDCRIQFVRAPRVESGIRLKMYWMCVLRDIFSDDLSCISKKLEIAHDLCFDCFCDSLTDKCKDLFR